MQDNLLILAIFLLALPFWFIGALILKIFIYIKQLPRVEVVKNVPTEARRGKPKVSKTPYLGQDGLYDYRNEAQTRDTYDQTIEYITERIKEDLMNG